MDVNAVVEIIKKLTLAAPFLMAFSAGWKYLPVIRNTMNEGVIPVMNALLTFFVVLGGGQQVAAPVVGLLFPSVAHAGILGDIKHALDPAIGAFVSVTFSLLLAKVADKFVKPFTPASPYTQRMGGTA